MAAQADIDPGMDLVSHPDLQVTRLVDLLLDDLQFAHHLLVQLGQAAQLPGIVKQYLAALLRSGLDKAADLHRIDAGDAQTFQQLGHLLATLI